MAPPPLARQPTDRIVRAGAPGCDRQHNSSFFRTGRDYPNASVGSLLASTDKNQSPSKVQPRRGLQTYNSATRARGWGETGSACVALTTLRPELPKSVPNCSLRWVGGGLWIS
jgi:hypothetical protein